MSIKVLLLTLISFPFLAGCGGKSPVSDTTPVENKPTNLIETTLNDVSCEESVADHLKVTAAANLDNSQKVADADAITVNYVGRLSDGSVFDTSVQAIAKACGLYAEARNYDQKLDFTVGSKQVIAGFDSGVIDMSLNETKTIEIPAGDAYGQALVSFPIDQLPKKEDGSSYVLGDTIMTMSGPVKIESLDAKEFSIKNAHPMAGKDLIFDVTVLKID